MKCQWITPSGQCRTEAQENSTFCDKHGGRPKPTQGLRHYLLTNQLMGDSTARHTAVEEIKDLREEIALSRALIETRLNMAQDETELAASMGILHQYLSTVEKLVSACHKMDTNLGNLLNKASVLTLAQELVNILAQELENVPDRDEIVDRISRKILLTIGTKSNVTPD